MTLRETSESFGVGRHILSTRAEISRLPKTSNASDVVVERLGVGGTLRPPPDLNDIADDIRQVLGTGRDSGLSRRALKYAPLCLWECDRPLADDKQILEAVLREIHRAGRRSVVRGLASAFFRVYPSDLPGLDLVGEMLKRIISEEYGPLYELHKRFNLFDRRLGPYYVSSKCLEDQELPQQFLRRHGVANDAVSRGVGLSVFREGMDQISNFLSNSQSIEDVYLARLWVEEPEGVSYEGAHRALAGSLLLPFEQTDPREDVKEAILSVVLDVLGDPRTRQTKWIGSESAADVAKRWLTRLALQQFLDIVDETAYAAHWDYRRAFWMSFYEKDAIQEAWVAFGPVGAYKAKQSFGKNASFGRLTASSKPVEPGHAVLLMRIGDYTVVDWSHNGRCIIWPTSDKAAPSLYQQIYLSGVLAPSFAPDGGLEQAHHGAVSYNWQRRVASFVAEKTGYEVREHDFRIT